MSKRLKVPRASIACTILDDPEYMGLMQTPAGRDAFALFCALLAAAKAQDNKGTFKHPASVVAAMLRWPVGDYSAALATLCAETNWITCDGHAVTIRSFRKWNSWGGKRDQDDTKIAPKMGARLQQDASKIAPRVATPVSVSVTDSLTTKASAHENEPDPVRNALAEVNGETTPGGDTTEGDPQFETFWQHYPPVNKHGRAEAERAWFRLTPAERVKAAAAVAAYAKAKATGPPDHRRRVLKPCNWLESRVFEQDPATWLPAQETSKVSAQFARSDDAYFSQS